MSTEAADPNITETLKHRRGRIAAIEECLAKMLFSPIIINRAAFPKDMDDEQIFAAVRSTQFVIAEDLPTITSIENMWLKGARQGLALARGWLGKALQATGEPYPYPNGNDASSETIDPKAYEPAEPSIELGDSPIKNIKIVRTAIGAVAEEMMADDVFGPLHNGAWGWNCQRRALDHLVEARLLLGEALGAMPSAPSPNVASVE